MLNLWNKVAAVAVLTAALPSVLAAQAISTVIPFEAPTAGISVDPIRDLVYVVAPQPDGVTVNLSVISGTTNGVTKTIPLTSGAYFPAVDYLSNKIYVAGCNYQVQPAACSVTVVNGKSNTVTATIPITTTPGEGLTGIAVNPLNGVVYVANASDNVIDVINGWENKLLAKITLNGNSPRIRRPEPRPESSVCSLRQQPDCGCRCGKQEDPQDHNLRIRHGRSSGQSVYG